VARVKRAPALMDRVARRRGSGAQVQRHPDSSEEEALNLGRQDLLGL
jgi:hypothetical protein